MIDYNVLKQIRDNVDDKETVLSIIQSLSFNQERCKDWLIEKSEPYLQALDDPKICVAAGWYGLLASKLRDFTDNEIVSFDIDPKCKTIGKKLYSDDYGIIFKTKDINLFNPRSYQVVICTSCEHITDDELNNFLSKIKEGSLVILQSNNYNIPEHINYKNNIGEFEWSVNLNVSWRGELDMDKYTRFMLCGIK